MITGIVVIYALSAAAAFLLFCRDSLGTFGSLSRGDIMFFATLSLFGPVSLCAGLIVAGIGLLESGFWSKKVWPR